MWIKWPAAPDNDLKPWYLILRVALFCPLIYGGKIITFVGLLLGAGVEPARSFWETSYV